MRWLFLSLALMAGLAQSNNPIPSEAKKATVPKQQTANTNEPAAKDQRGTKEQPFFIQIVDSAKADSKPAKNEQKHGDKPSFIWGMTAEEATAIFTFALVIVGALTATVLVCQSYLLGQQVVAARNEFISSHHPRITLREAISIKSWGNPIIVRYTLANIGGTRAKIIKSAFTIRVDTVEGMKLLPDCSKTNQTGEIVLEPGTHYRNEVKSGDKWPDVPAGSPWSFEGHNNIFFSGHLIYVDDSGIQRHTAFYRSYDPVASRFYTSAARIMGPLNYED